MVCRLRVQVMEPSFQRDSQLARRRGYTVGPHVMACRNRARSSTGKWQGVELRNARPKHSLRMTRQSSPGFSFQHCPGHTQSQEVAPFGASTINKLSASTSEIQRCRVARLVWRCIPELLELSYGMAGNFAPGHNRRNGPRSAAELLLHWQLGIRFGGSGR